MVGLDPEFERQGGHCKKHISERYKTIPWPPPNSLNFLNNAPLQNKKSS